jgi:hypothetical protein
MVFVLAAPSATVANVITALDAVAAGTRQPSAVRLAYHEEHPLRRTVEVVVERDGTVRRTTRLLDSRCPQPGDASCWTERVRRVTLSPDAHRHLIARASGARMAALPREDTPPPGAARMHLTVEADGEGTLEAASSLDAALRSPGFELLREALLIAAGPPEGPPGADIPRAGDPPDARPSPRK